MGCKAAGLALLMLLVASVGAEDVVTLQGTVTQGALVLGRTAPQAQVLFEGRPVRLSKEGVFLIGFGRDASGHAELRISFADGTSIKRWLQVAKRDYPVQSVEGLPPRKVEPKPSDQQRIRAEAKLVQEARRRDDPRSDFLSGFLWPVPGKITGVYGSQRILNGVPRRPHYGVDIAAPQGTPVLAPADGLVTLAHEDMFLSGGTLIVDHGHGLSSSLLHLNRILVRTGQAVRQGETIAEVGASGRATGAHLDWRINLFHKRLDPALVFAAVPASAEALPLDNGHERARPSPIAERRD